MFFLWQSPSGWPKSDSSSIPKITTCPKSVNDPLEEISRWFLFVLFLLDEFLSSGVLIHFALLLQQPSHVFKNVNFVMDNIIF